MKNKFSRTFFKMTIRTPFMAFFLFILMIVVVVLISYNTMIDVYVDKKGVIQQDKTPMIYVQLTESEVAEIDLSHPAKWYLNRNDHIYSSSIHEVQRGDSDYVVIVLAANNNLDHIEQDQAVQVEFFVHKERVLNSLISG